MLKELREALVITQEELAQTLGWRSAACGYRQNRTKRTKTEQEK